MSTSASEGTQPALRWLRRTLTSGPIRPEQHCFGVLSGRFNPPTLAHLALAAAALDQLALHEIVFVLPENPPHKQELAPSHAERAEMLLLATEAESRYSVAVTRDGLFLDIYRALKPHLPPDARILFLAGRDAAERILLHWPYVDSERALAEMFAAFEVAVADRSGQFTIPPQAPARRFAERIHRLNLPPEFDALSATAVRERLRRGEPIWDCVPEPVARYIYRRHLYVGA